MPQLCATSNLASGNALVNVAKNFFASALPFTVPRCPWYSTSSASLPRKSASTFFSSAPYSAFGASARVSSSAAPVEATISGDAGTAGIAVPLPFTCSITVPSSP